MPANLLQADLGFPKLDETQSNDEKITQIVDYLYMLLEQLRYNFGNIDKDNFNDTGLVELEEEINKNVYIRLEGDEGQISELSVTAENLTSRMGNAEGDISTLTQTATGLSSRITDAEGNISTLTQSSEAMGARLTNAEGNISTLTQTATALSSRITDAEGNISSITQTVHGMELRVQNGDTTSTISLYQDGAAISSKNITFTGLVSFNDLSTAGSTVINGANITTGTINAINITGSTISGGTVSGTAITGGTISGTTVTGGTVTGTAISGGTITIGNNFSVSNTGVMTASGADITGEVNATSGKIAGWNINNNRLQNSTGTIYLDGGTGTISGATISGGTVSGTTVTGTTITGGTISGTSISGGSLTGTSISGGSISIGTGSNPAFKVTSGGAVTASNVTITGGSLSIGNSFSVTNTGTLTATNADITGEITATSGQIAGWDINGNKLQNNTGTIYLDGGTGTISGAFINGGSLNGTIGSFAGNLSGAEIMIGEGNGYIYPGISSEGITALEILGTTGLRLFSKANIYLRSYSEGSPYTSITLEDSNVRNRGNFTPLSNNNYSLGSSSAKWTDVYAQNGSIQTSDRQVKHDIDHDLTDYDAFYDSIEPVSYMFTDGHRKHIGFIAQEVEEALADNGIDTEDFAGFIKSEAETGEYNYGLRYTEFIALNTYEIKKLKKRIAELEALHEN